MPLPMRSDRTAAVVVLDPVMVATCGAGCSPPTLDALRERLLPLATSSRPNLPEAELLLGHAIPDREAMQAACAALIGRGARAVLLKGGHLVGRRRCIDLFADGRWRSTAFAHPRLPLEGHGTGCTLASAVAANLCLGKPLRAACERRIGLRASRAALGLPAGTRWRRRARPLRRHGVKVEGARDPAARQPTATPGRCPTHSRTAPCRIAVAAGHGRRRQALPGLRRCAGRARHRHVCARMARQWQQQPARRSPHDSGYRELLTCDLPASEAAIEAARCPRSPASSADTASAAQLACCRLALAPQSARTLWLVAGGSPYWRAFPAATRSWLPMAYRFLPMARRTSAARCLAAGSALVGRSPPRHPLDWSRSALSGRYAARGLAVDLEAAMARSPFPSARSSSPRTGWRSPSLHFLLSKLPRSTPTIATLAAASGQRADHFAWMRQPERTVDALMV